ncbi:Hypothetical protein HVR_LOCUS184 [uncultured virus]|nr:Hypothetical protein HVR_LOCUS184 [uncultured virus]
MSETNNLTTSGIINDLTTADATHLTTRSEHSFDLTTRSDHPVVITIMDAEDACSSIILPPQDEQLHHTSLNLTSKEALLLSVEGPLSLLSKERFLEAIHQCVIYSTIRHVLTFPHEIIVEYLATYPFYRGADTLYYFILRKVGRDAHYGPNGKHIISLNPELAGVYVLAEQDMKAPIMKYSDSSFDKRVSVDKTIYSIVKNSVDRTILCPRYQLRHSIIVGDAAIEDAVKIPSISLNIPKYQTFYQANFSMDLISLLVEQDCWEPIPTLNFTVITMMTTRMSYIAAIAPDLWKLSLCQYYAERLATLNIHEYLPKIISKYLNVLNTLLPDLIRLPPNFDTLSTRLWFTNRLTRAYLLGFDLNDGIPSDEIVSESIQHLRNVGVEKYAEEITGIYLTNDGKLTGQIGNTHYNYLEGKRLVLPKSGPGDVQVERRLSALGSMYVYDLIHITVEDRAYVIPLVNIVGIIKGGMMPEYIQEIFSSGVIDNIKENVDIETANRILSQLTTKLNTNRCIPARIRLVEIMSHDIVDY